MNDEIIDVSDDIVEKKDNFIKVIYILLIALVILFIFFYFFGYEILKPFIKV